jgi:O-antigen ligase
MTTLNRINLISQLNKQMLNSKNIHIGLYWLSSFIVFVMLASSINYPTAFYYACISLCLLSLFALLLRTDNQPLSKLEKVMLLTWLSYPALIVLDFWLRTGWNWPTFQEPSRFILVLPIFLMVRRFGISQDALKWGVFVGALFAGVWALYQKQVIGMHRAFGGTSSLVHAFGDISLLLGFMSVALFQPNWSKNWSWSFIVLISLSLGVFASLASGTKGGWISAPILCWLMVSLTRHPTYTKRFIVLAVMVTGAVLVWYFSPFIQARVGNIPHEINVYFEANKVNGSAGHRLALWHTAILIFIDNPLFGTGVNSYAVAKIPYIESGLVPSIVKGDIGVHSQFFNVLQELGLLGVISVLSIYVVFIMYCRQFISANKGLAIAGLFLALSFIDFGFVESIWGINNAGVFFTVMMALIAGQLAYEKKHYQ